MAPEKLIAAILFGVDLVGTGVEKQFRLFSVIVVSTRRNSCGWEKFGSGGTLQEVDASGCSMSVCMTEELCITGCRCA